MAAATWRRAGQSRVARGSAASTRGGGRVRRALCRKHTVALPPTPEALVCDSRHRTLGRPQQRRKAELRPGGGRNVPRRGWEFNHEGRGSQTDARKVTEWKFLGDFAEGRNSELHLLLIQLQDHLLASFHMQGSVLLNRLFSHKQ